MNVHQSKFPLQEVPACPQTSGVVTLPPNTPPLLTTNELAGIDRCVPQTIRKNFSQQGHHHGMVPIKLPNGQLRWRSAQLTLLLNGQSLTGSFATADVDTAAITGAEHAAAFIQSMSYSSLSGDELFDWLRHYLKPQSREAENYLRAYLRRVQAELSGGV